MFVGLTNELQVNDFITTLGSNVVNESGNQTDLKPALFTLVNFITGKKTFPEKHYDYLGESVCTFAIHCLLSKIYFESPVSKLKAMELAFQDLGRLAEAQMTRINLNQYIETGHTKEAFFYLLGILYDSFDSRVVERFIEPSVKDILLNKYPLEEDAISTLTKFIVSKKGNLDTSYIKLGTRWRAILTCKLRPNGIVFTHDAIGSSKQKAKSEACQAILKYMKDNPSELERFETGEPTNNEIIPLNISSSTAYSSLVQEEESRIKDENDLRQHAESLLGQGDVIQPIGTKRMDYELFPTATPFGPFTAYSSSKKTLDKFRDIFSSDLTKLRELSTSHEIKGALLSILNNKPNVTYKTNLEQTGEIHNPIFTVELEVTSDKYLLRTTGSGRKKKDAEMQAYQRFARLLTKTP